MSKILPLSTFWCRKAFFFWNITVAFFTILTGYILENLLWKEFYAGCSPVVIIHYSKKLGRDKLGSYCEQSKSILFKTFLKSSGWMKMHLLYWCIFIYLEDFYHQAFVNVFVWIWICYQKIRFDIMKLYNRIQKFIY